MLDKQIQIYSVDTGNFYSNRESYLHRLNHKVRQERNALKKELKFYEDVLTEIGFTQEDIKNIQNGKFDKVNYDGKDVITIDDNNHVIYNCISIKDAFDYWKLYNLFKYKGVKAKEIKDKMLTLLQNKVDANIVSNGKHHTRELRFINECGKEVDPNESNIISVFDSSFTRMIGAMPDKLCEDFMVIQVYYFDVIKDVIYHGFNYKGEKYIYFTSSAGQIRTKKCVFVKESIWNKYEKSIMCGLTIDKINEKGGNNPNKHLAYMALTNSATDLWEEFDIDKTIVIDDFETDVFGTYDFINDEDYSITRTDGFVPITHTDGAGMMLPCLGKNRMVRLPWIKGLLGVFDYVKFINKNNCSPIIKDIYGKEHDVIKEDIQIIFTKSQFKMYKYYDSWEQYKEYYKKYNCTAGYTNMEEDRIKNATINYQMLQSLTDITDEEINDIAWKSICKLNNLCSSVKNIQEVFGATPYNLYKNPLQEAICLYPELLNDIYIKSKLRDIKDSLIKKYKSGKLEVYGKYTFLLPDFYAACEYWFKGEKLPKGLLADGEVFCWLFRKSDKLDCLRSPHLYKEHAIRNNMAWNLCDRQEEIREWFTTDAIYTSSYDLISKVLQFDVDGDKSLVVADKNIISVAEENMKEVVPLYYNMKKALPSVLNNQSIYDGLKNAFTGGNIGIYSNNISKIWNSDVFINGTEEEKKQAIDCVKCLCCQNNYVIDYAKTLYKPEFPKDIKDNIQAFTKNNLPHFFIYAKDKEEHQVEKKNKSFVNKLDDIIPNPRICSKYVDGDGRTKKLSRPNYLLLTRYDNEHINIKDFMIKYKDIIDEFNKYMRKYSMKVDATNIDTSPFELMIKTKIKDSLVYTKLKNEIKESMRKYGDDEFISDILVTYLYGIKNSRHKDLLWICYGEYMLKNLKSHIKQHTKIVQCVDCGEWFEVGIKNNRTCRCDECTKEYRNIYQKNLMREIRKC